LTSVDADSAWRFPPAIALAATGTAVRAPGDAMRRRLPASVESELDSGRASNGFDLGGGMSGGDAGGGE